MQGAKKVEKEGAYRGRKK